MADEELDRYTHTAQSAGLTLSEWARQALRAAERRQSIGDVDAQLALIRRAAEVERGGREVDVEQMLAQAQIGRLGDSATSSSSHT